jgi:hypothetical protein
MTIGGLPLHPLVVHATVVILPLTITLVIAFAVLPGWRWMTRWPSAVLSVACIALAYAATITGKSLENSNPVFGQLVATHQQRGHLLALLTIPFAVLVVASAFLLSGTSALASGRGAWVARVPVLDKILPVVLVLAGIGLLVLVVLTGDSGARAVWGTH